MGVKKTCSTCKEIKSIACFYKQPKGLYGRTGSCKECRKKTSNNWAEKNKDRKNLLERERKRDRKQYCEKWRKENPNYFKEYYKQNREIRLECNRRFWENNPERYESWKIYQRARSNRILINPGQCQMCGTKEMKIQAHHFDYSKPLEVCWVCIECHKDVHRRKKFNL